MLDRISRSISEKKKPHKCCGERPQLDVIHILVMTCERVQGTDADGAEQESKMDEKGDEKHTLEPEMLANQ